MRRLRDWLRGRLQAALVKAAQATEGKTYHTGSKQLLWYATDRFTSLPDTVRAHLLFLSWIVRQQERLHAFVHMRGYRPDKGTPWYLREESK